MKLLTNISLNLLNHTSTILNSLTPQSTHYIVNPCWCFLMPHPTHDDTKSTQMLLADRLFSAWRRLVLNHGKCFSGIAVPIAKRIIGQRIKKIAKYVLPSLVTRRCLKGPTAEVRLSNMFPANACSIDLLNVAYRHN